MIPFSSLLITTAYTRGKSQTVTTPCKTDSLKTFAVSGRVTQTYSYCGGASPPKQVLDRLANPVAYSGKKFYIRQGKANSTKAKVVKSFITGKDGEYLFKDVVVGDGVTTIVKRCRGRRAA